MENKTKAVLCGVMVTVASASSYASQNNNNELETFNCEQLTNDNKQAEPKVDSLIDIEACDKQQLNPHTEYQLLSDSDKRKRRHVKQSWWEWLFANNDVSLKSDDHKFS